MEKLSEQRTNPYFTEYYHDHVGPLEVSEADLEKGLQFTNGLLKLKDAFSGVSDEYAQFFSGRIENGVMVVIPSYPVQRTVKKHGSFYTWMVKPETTESMDLLAIEYIEVKCDRENPDRLIAEGTSPAYRCYGGEASLQEVYRFDPTGHKIAILSGNFEPDTRT